MQTYITSDLHLGLKQCRADAFLAFLAALPPGARLVLNGDIITHFLTDRNLSPEHAHVVDKLRLASYEREIIWVRGNNDKKLILADPGKFQFVSEFSIDKRLYISHGHRFDWLMPATRGGLVVVRVIYQSVARLFGAKMHVAEFAKRFSGLYDVLCQHVARNAVRYARRHGYAAVTCGHTHYPEDRMIDGIRYLNTGCWTEANAAVVVVDGDGGAFCDADRFCIHSSSPEAMSASA